MKTYAELDLVKIREEAGLDFARCTYSKGQCTCCYGPLDMSAKYWRKGRKAFFKKSGRYDYSYLLFRNADNCLDDNFRSMTESQRFNRYILPHTYINYHFYSEEQKMLVCKLLQEQLGSEYTVHIPDDDTQCIEICMSESKG